MDPLTLIGIALVFVAIIVSTLIDGNSFGPLIGPSSLLLVLVGTIGATFAGYRMDAVKKLPQGLIVALTGTPDDADELVTQLMQYAEAARKEGILALETGLEDMDNQFLATGLQLVVDGLESEEVREVMEAEITAMEARHEVMIGMYKKLVEYAPTLGMIGTVIGLVNILGNLADPAALGTGMALALLTTLYGVVFANIFFSPIGAKLGVLNELEVMTRELTVEGVISIREGASPRHLVEKLEAYLQPDLRVGSKARLERAA